MDIAVYNDNNIAYPEIYSVLIYFYKICMIKNIR